MKNNREVPRPSVVTSFVYEGSLHGAGLGGARFHFLGISSALAGRLGSALTVLLPSFHHIPSFVQSLPHGVRVVELRSWRKGVAGFLLYEIRKAAWYWRHRRRSSAATPILLTRLSYYGLSTPLARALGWRVILEVNGIPSREARDRGLNLPTRVFIALAAWLQVRAAHKLICVTPGIADEMARFTAKPREVIPNGVDLGKFPPLPVEQALSRRSMIFVGTLAPWQDVPLVLEALNVLRLEEQDAEPWTLTIVGNGECWGELHAHTERLGLQDRVRFLGWQPHEKVSTFIAQAWICVIPLRKEAGAHSSPLKLFEYIASNRIVVASNVGGVMHLSLPLIEHYDASDVASLMSALRRAASLSPLDPKDVELLRHQISWDERAERVLQFAAQ